MVHGPAKNARAAAESRNREPAVEIVLQIRGGDRRAIVQAAGSEVFAPGDAVMLVTSAPLPSMPGSFGRTTWDVLSEITSDPELIAVLTGQWGDLGLPPKRSSFVVQALTALLLFHRDKHYIIADRKVRIVDEYTGRVMPDRHWERGLHQLRRRVRRQAGRSNRRARSDHLPLHSSRRRQPAERLRVRPASV